MLFHCRAVKLPAVVRQTSHRTASHRGGHSSAPVEPKPSGARRSTRNKNNHNEEDPLGSVPDILQVDTVDDAIDKPKQVQRRQVACRGKCFEPMQAPIRKIEKPQLKACSVVVGLETDIEKVVEKENQSLRINQNQSRRKVLLLINQNQSRRKLLLKV